MATVLLVLSGSAACRHSAVSGATTGRVFTKLSVLEIAGAAWGPLGMSVTQGPARPRPTCRGAPWVAPPPPQPPPHPHPSLRCQCIAVTSTLPLSRSCTGRHRRPGGMVHRPTHCRSVSTQRRTHTHTPQGVCPLRHALVYTRGKQGKPVQGKKHIMGYHTASSRSDEISQIFRK